MMDTMRWYLFFMGCQKASCKLDLVVYSDLHYGKILMISRETDLRTGAFQSLGQELPTSADSVSLEGLVYLQGFGQMEDLILLYYLLLTHDICKRCLAIQYCQKM